MPISAGWLLRRRYGENHPSLFVCYAHLSGLVVETLCLPVLQLSVRIVLKY